MDTKLPECWMCEPKTACLRVILDAKHTLILPYAHFRHADFEDKDDGEELKLVFTSHEVVLTGHLLKRLEIGIAAQEVGEVSALPERYHRIAGERPFIRQIAMLVVSAKSETL